MRQAKYKERPRLTIACVHLASKIKTAEEIDSLPIDVTMQDSVNIDAFGSSLEANGFPPLTFLASACLLSATRTDVEVEKRTYFAIVSQDWN